jgi:hypothetical protein
MKTAIAAIIIAIALAASVGLGYVLFKLMGLWR